MANPTVSFTDFSGGIHESGSPAAFTPRQWQRLRGFVIEPNGSLRSQWECQQVGSFEDVKSVYTFRSGSKNFVVLLTQQGVLRWAEAPSDRDLYEIVSGWDFTDLAIGTDTNGNSVPIPDSTSYRFLCVVPATVDDFSTPKSGLLINSSNTSDPAIILKEAGGVLKATVYNSASERYPDFYMANEFGDVTGNAEKDIVEYAKAGVIPHGTCGAMWGDVLCIGVGRWYKSWQDANKYNGNPAVKLSESTTTIHQNGFWTSYVSPNGTPIISGFHPFRSFNTGFLDPEAVITDFQVIETGMLVFTTTVSTGRSGVILLRGTPYDYRPIVLKDNIGTPYTTPQDDYQCVTGYWPEAGITAFVEANGGIWYTDGEEVDRLDRVGPYHVTEGAWGDCAASVRGYLIVSRHNRVLCLNSVGREDTPGSSNKVAAWTSLITPQMTSPVTSLTSIDESIYFVQDNKLWRYTLQGVYRGHINTVAINPEVITAPVGENDTFNQYRWARVGVEAHALLIERAQILPAPDIPVFETGRRFDDGYFDEGDFESFLSVPDDDLEEIDD